MSQEYYHLHGYTPAPRQKHVESHWHQLESSSYWGPRTTIFLHDDIPP